MNIFFQNKYQYVVYDSLENIRMEIKSLANTKWYDFSNNITGLVNDDDSFRLYPKISFAINVFGVPTNIAVIDGKLETGGMIKQL